VTETPAAHPHSVPVPADAPGAPAPAPRPPIASESLFGGAREVQIVHRGTLYRLKQTALGKLILTK
jgi:hemin uptake protein HemP